MAQPFLISMEHPEWHPPDIIRRRIPKRPLGRLESDARFTPRQPVLSSRTLDIDKSGSRTYRAKSTSAIIEEQHQLLHDVYNNNRLAKAAEGRRTTQPQAPSQQGDPKRRRFLIINGQSPNRPWTSVERSKSADKSNGQKKRPHTTGGRGKNSGARPATDTHLKLEVDAGLEASAHALQRAQQQVKDLWRPDSNNLDDGVFVRGRGAGELSGTDNRSATWLNFSGGDEDESGLVQAFTAAMRGRGGEFYTINGTVGTHVARQLRRGDRVRVGINGQVQSTTLRVKRWRKDGRGDEVETPTTQVDEDPQSVPLCWADQVSQSEKVLEPRVTTKPPPKKNLCDSRPVIYERLLTEDRLGRHHSTLRSTSGVGSGFAVRSRTKCRIGIDGSTAQPITNVTITDDTDEGEADSMSVEDVLERTLQGREWQQPPERKRQDLAIPNLTDLRTHEGSKAAKRGPPASRTPPTSARSGKQEVPSPPPSRAAVSTPWSMNGGSGAAGDSRSVRPLTAHSAHSIDQNFDSFVVTATNSTSGKPGSARSGGRATSGKRPPPAKPMLHRSAAAMGASIGSAHSNKTEAPAYIQITQSITSPQQQAEQALVEQTVSQGILPPTPASMDGLSLEAASVIDQDLNPDEFPELESDLEDANMEEKEDQQEHDEPPPEASSDTIHGDNFHTEEPQEDSNVDPPLSPRGSDVRYAFNIPTASEVEDDDEEGVIPERQSLHDKLVEQTANLLAGAIIGADLPADLCQPHPGQ